MSGHMVEVTLRMVEHDTAVARLRVFAEKHGWAVVQVHRPDATPPGPRPMLATVPDAVGEVVKLRASGLSLRAIAANLNGRGLAGAHGGRWWAKTVQAALRQAQRSVPKPGAGG